MKTLTWQKPGQQNVAQELIKKIINYVAELRIDTTFAVYKPYFIGEPIDPDCFCIRTGYPYSVRHLPWYMNSAKPTEEELYYLGHIKTLTHWSKQNQTNTNSAKKE